MASINTQAVIDAVTLALRESFPGALIFDDITMQGLSPGSFIVKLVSAAQRRVIGARFSCTPMFEVIYFSNSSTAECIEMADKLTAALSIIKTPGGDLLHGSGMDWQTKEYVLQFKVGYNYFILRKNEQERMGGRICITTES